MSKDDIKIFTGSGVLKVDKPQDKKENAQYIQATGGDESIVHDKCGTPDCCGECKPSAYSHIKRRIN